MKERRAYQLLFVRDFGGTPLFKNQGYLAAELLDNHQSAYYTLKTDPDYQKKLGNLKVYVSQLFSDNTRRTVTSDFKKSLQALIRGKFITTSFDTASVADDIINDLIQKNALPKIEVAKETEPDPLQDFFTHLSNASYVSIFSSREFRLETRSNFVDMLVDGLVLSLFEGTQNKWYRFNFPLDQLCSLFWMGVRKELQKHIAESKQPRKWIVKTLHDNKVISLNNDELPEDDPEFESRIADQIVEHLSRNDIITVFHLPAPVYLFPTIALNPNDRQSMHTYCILQSDTGLDQLHKLTRDEMLLWNFFVWNNLRLNNAGKPYKYPETTNTK